jgi:hypothetical protein
MLRKYSMIITVLLVVTASLVGISSVYKPANVETQPQPQPQKPDPYLIQPKFKGQIVTPLTIRDQQNYQMI